MAGPIEHVIVLMLENRSFDHLLGFLKTKRGTAFEGLEGNESNVLYPGDTVTVSADATYALGADPDHSHAGVLSQLLGRPPELVDYHDDGAFTMQGFAWAYEQRSLEEGLPRGHGRNIMRCFDPEDVPVVATLAREYAVFDHWFASVPGETWPNRNYVHAATSHGKVDIELRPYWNETIFEQLEGVDGLDRPWGIYHDGPCQAWAFPKLWVPVWRDRFHDIGTLYQHIQKDQLPAYAFIEPNHGLLFGRQLQDSNSQHPGNNLESGRDFLAGERLVRDVYEALRKKPGVFRKTLLLVTYDEHGGFYDHVPPPPATPPGDRTGVEDSDFGFGPFRFDRLGVRVPAVAVSPRIRRGTVDQTVYDHSAVPATVRKLLAPQLGALTDRDAKANTFDRVLSDTLRPESQWPEVRALRTGSLRRLGQPPHLPRRVDPARALGAHERAMVGLAQEVERSLDDEKRLNLDPTMEVRWWEPDEARIDELARQPRKLSAWLDHVKRLFRSRTPRQG